MALTQCTSLDSNGARGKSGPGVQAIDLVARKLAEQPLAHHQLAARLSVRELDARPCKLAGRLLVGLEDEGDGPAEIAGGGEVLGSAEEHGRVAIVAAAMVRPVSSTLVLVRRHLLCRQSVHVCAKPDAAIRGAFALEDANDSSRTSNGTDGDFDAPRPKQPRHHVARPVLLEAKFGVPVDVVPPADHELVVLGDLGFYARQRRMHPLALCLLRRRREQAVEVARVEERTHADVPLRDGHFHLIHTNTANIFGMGW